MIRPALLMALVALAGCGVDGAPLTPGLTVGGTPGVTGNTGLAVGGTPGTPGVAVGGDGYMGVVGTL